jgi:hypothetical protein
MPPVKRKPRTRTHRQMAEAWKKDPEFKAAYDEFDTEFALLRQLFAARRKAGLTQAGVAAKMGTSPLLSPGWRRPSLPTCIPPRWPR